MVMFCLMRILFSYRSFSKTMSFSRIVFLLSVFRVSSILFKVWDIFSVTRYFCYRHMKHIIRLITCVFRRYLIPNFTELVNLLSLSLGSLYKELCIVSILLFKELPLFGPEFYFVLKYPYSLRLSRGKIW